MQAGKCFRMKDNSAYIILRHEVGLQLDWANWNVCTPCDDNGSLLMGPFP